MIHGLLVCMVVNITRILMARYSTGGVVARAFVVAISHDDFMMERRAQASGALLWWPMDR